VEEKLTKLWWSSGGGWWSEMEVWRRRRRVGAATDKTRGCACV